MISLVVVVIMRIKIFKHNQSNNFHHHTVHASQLCMLIVSNCKSYVIEKFCIVCDINNNYCEHADLNGGGDVCCDADCLCDGYV